jgi:hemoglobin-like flavoprotein
MVYECQRRPAHAGLVVQVSGGTLARIKQRRSGNQDQIQISEKRVDTIRGAGLNRPALFFAQGHQAFARVMTNPIERSLALAAERCEDLTPLVYARLHREHPETMAMFRTQGSELVKGSMLALTLEAILDFAGERSAKFRMIECEVSSHDAYGTPRELFFAFFGVIAATLRELLGADWSAEMEKAWADMLAEIGGIVASQDA